MGTVLTQGPLLTQVPEETTTFRITDAIMMQIHNLIIILDYSILMEFLI
jgi:hypothetical protein